jgi:hypothetical protein
LGAIYVALADGKTTFTLFLVVCFTSYNLMGRLQPTVFETNAFNLKKHITNSAGWYTLHFLKIILENKALGLILLGFRVNFMSAKFNSTNCN